MTRTILAVVAVLAVGCSSGSPDAAWPWNDAATLSTACPTPARVIRDVARTRDASGAVVVSDPYANCPADASSWWTYDPTPVFHCEWRCVNYACATGQDVRIDYDGDSADIVAIVSGASGYCASVTSPPLSAR